MYIVRTEFVNEAYRMMHSSWQGCTLRATGGSLSFLRLKNAILLETAHIIVIPFPDKFGRHGGHIVWQLTFSGVKTRRN